MASNRGIGIRAPRETVDRFAAERDRRGLTSAELLKELLANESRERRSRVSIRELPSVGRLQWDVSAIRSARTALMNGQPQQIADLAAVMECDESFKPAMRKRVGGLVRSTLTVMPRDDSPAARRAADLVRAHIGAMLPEAELHELVKNWHTVSVAPAVLDWCLDGDRMTPQLRCLSPRNLTWDAMGGGWRFNSSNGIVDVTPGAAGWVLLSSWRYGSVGNAICAELAEAWAAKRAAQASHAEWNDANSWPILKVVTPAGGDAETNSAFFSQVASARLHRVIQTPRGTDANNSYDVESVSTGTGSEWQSFVEIISRADRKMQIAWLGGNLSSEVAVNGGNRAAAAVHRGVERDLIEGDIAMVEPVIADQVIRPFVEWHLGSAPVPRIAWDLGQTEDAADTAASLVSVMQFLTAQVPGYDIENIEEIAARFGIRLRRKESEGVNNIPLPTR